MGPGFEFCVEGVDVGDAPSQALPGTAGQFDLSDVEPASVLGGVVDLQSAGESEGLLWRERLVERVGCIKVLGQGLS